MPKKPRSDPKVDALRKQRALNPRAQRVTDTLFRDNDFFDARDLVQVKYEMLRRVEAEGQSVTSASASFGFSRPSFYEAHKALGQLGLAGLVPKKRGPRAGHKLNHEAIDFLELARTEDSSVGTAELVHRVKERFGIQVHPRSVERALRRREKKR